MTVARVRRECEELRAHCLRQREMIAEQRETLRRLAQQQTFGGEESLAPGGAGVGRDEEARAGE